MQIGDLVTNPPNPHWGIGIVIELYVPAKTARVQWNYGGEMWVMFKNLEAV